MKQTARNNKFLEAVKKIMNNKIYYKALKIYNEQGQKETVEFLNQYCNWKEIERIYVPYSVQFYRD